MAACREEHGHHPQEHESLTTITKSKELNRERPHMDTAGPPLPLNHEDMQDGEEGEHKDREGCQLGEEGPLWTLEEDDILDLEERGVLEGTTICRDLYIARGEIPPGTMLRICHVDNLDRFEVMLDHAMGLIQGVIQGKELSPMDRSKLDDLLDELRAPAGYFVAGRWRLHAKMWEKYLKYMGVMGKENASLVLQILNDGYKFPWVKTDAESQAGIPQGAKKLQIVRQMLRKALPGLKEEEIEEYLAGNMPRRVQLPNHRSTLQYEQHVREEIPKLLAKGVVVEITQAHAVVINGLKVVDAKAPKLRICINPMYINCFLKYKEFSYERLVDAGALFAKGDWMYSTDDTSGYWHIPLHSSAWPYVAFQWDGRVYAFTHMPFGIATACRLYTVIKKLIFQPLRAWGLRMLQYIDDQCGAASTKALARDQSKLVLAILMALGTIVSMDKSHVEPVQQLVFLGLELDSEQGLYRVTPKKLKVIEGLLEGLGGTTYTRRQVAIVAGNLVSCYPAVKLANLFANMLYKAVVGRVGWDVVTDSTEALHREVMLIAEEVLMNHTSLWVECRHTIKVVTDASEVGVGAFTPEGEMQFPVAHRYSEEEAMNLKLNRFSSTAREIQAMLVALKALLATCREQVQGGKVVISTDNTGAFYNVLRMRGNPDTFQEVRDLRLLAAANDVVIVTEWHPRSHEWQIIADYWSKAPTGCERMLAGHVVRQIMENMRTITGLNVNIDLFASTWSSVVPKAFFSKYWCMDTLGVDAMGQEWDYMPGTTDGMVAWMEPPTHLVSAALRKLTVHQTSAVVVLPRNHEMWQVLLAHLPVKGNMVVRKGRDVYVPAPHLPWKMQDHQWRMQHDLLIYFVTWK
jgi:hypothetical protein